MSQFTINPSALAGRRRLLKGGLALSILSLGGITGCARAEPSGRTAANANTSSAAGPVMIAVYNDQGARVGLKEVARITKSPAAWQDQLSEQAYHITRESGTERPYTGQYYDAPPSHGLYACVCCDTALYDSDTQFHSGTGWPSFYQPIDDHNVTEHSDHSFGTTRTEIACTRCAAHIGHVFADGPEPTGLRYCMNAAAMVFHPIG